MYSMENKYMARLKSDQKAKEHTHFTQIQMYFPLLQPNCPRKVYSLIQSQVPSIYFYHEVTFQAAKFNSELQVFSADFQRQPLSLLPLPSQNKNCFSSLYCFCSSLLPFVMQTDETTLIKSGFILATQKGGLISQCRPVHLNVQTKYSSYWYQQN